jgi:LmbE family N-acetylglucosaminyl deacetylase
MPQHFSTLDQLPEAYDHVYLSPHLDDAALSCGGAIARHSANHQRVLVITICTAAPDLRVPFSPFAAAMHASWGLNPDRVVAQRLQEDIAALEILGADSFQLAQLDAIYRMPEQYTSDTALFSSPADDDPLLVALEQALGALTQRFPEAVLYAPLAIGQHVDHQITYAAALRLNKAGTPVAFYEDIPYVLVPGALERRLTTIDGQLLMPSIVTIDGYLARKLSAIEAYSSQIAMLFGDSQQMEQRVRSYASALRPESSTFGERLWLYR